MQPYNHSEFMRDRPQPKEIDLTKLKEAKANLGIWWDLYCEATAVSQAFNDKMNGISKND